ncbi:serine hydrolase [Peptostreptococcus faecalis]|uniref:serine hydrolase n=1 Tax=Peptostreptococcus faecalis TaxID=2045015 RepID=UPI0015E0A40D
MTVLFLIILNYCASNKFNSKNIYVYNLTDNEEILDINANEKVPLASLTKIMTTYVVLDNIDNISNKVTVVNKNIFNELINKNASRADYFYRYYHFIY